MINAKEIKEYKHFPYAVIGHTSLPTDFCITLTGVALRKIVEQMPTLSDLRITVGANGHKFEILLQNTMGKDISL